TPAYCAALLAPSTPQNLLLGTLSFRSIQVGSGNTIALHLKKLLLSGTLGYELLKDEVARLRNVRDPVTNPIIVRKRRADLDDVAGKKRKRNLYHLRRSACPSLGEVGEPLMEDQHSHTTFESNLSGSSSQPGEFEELEDEDDDTGHKEDMGV
ncbi:hypothetical protein DXG01_014766, partial [Tephrocybe rancida]